MIEFFVPGNPQALKRHRTYKGKNMKFAVETDPSVSDKADFLAKAMIHRPLKPLEGAINLHCRFFFSRPKNHFRGSKYSTMLKEGAPKYRSSRPDIDNLFKFVMDALNGIFWVDDSQVVICSSSKEYVSLAVKGISAGVDVHIEEIEK